MAAEHNSDDTMASPLTSWKIRPVTEQNKERIDLPLLSRSLFSSSVESPDWGQTPKSPDRITQDHAHGRTRLCAGGTTVGIRARGPRRTLREKAVP